MKVLLVFPNMKIVTGEPPLGLGYIAAYLRESAKIKILDTTFRPSIKWAEKFIKREKADIVGIYSSTVMFKDAIEIAKIAKKYDTPLVVMGGPHPSIRPEEVIRLQYIDAVVIGEGEYSFFKIVEKFENRNEIKDLVGIPNVYLKYNGKIIKNNARYFIENLDELPFPARDLFDMEKYIKHWFQFDVVYPNLRGTNVCLTRSCPFSCTFCQPTLKLMFGPKLRRRSPQNIVQEFKLLKEEYKINAVQSIDDLFFIDEKYIRNFCEELLKEKSDILWGCQSRVDTIPSDETLRLAYKSGLRMVSLGIESGCTRILKIYNKGISINQIKFAVRKLKKHGIKIRGYFIIGCPTETIKEIVQTIKLAVSLKLDEAAFSILTPFPGTYLYKIAESKGWLIDEEWDYKRYYSKGGFLTGTLPDGVIRKYQRLAFLAFYLHPYRFNYLLNSMLNLRRSFAKLRCYFV